MEIAINFKGGGGSNNGTKFYLNPFDLSKVIESSNMRSRNTLTKQYGFDKNSGKLLNKGLY